MTPSNDPVYFHVGLGKAASTWLQYDWNGTGDENPRGTATYGRFRGHDRIVYWRELVD